MDNITLYPSNWLYNAGVIGFLKVLEMCGERVENFLKDDGSVEIERDIFNMINVNEIYFNKNTKVASIVGNVPIYRNYLQKGRENAFEYYVKNLCKVQNKNSSICDICAIGFYLPDSVISSYTNNENLQKFLNGIRRFDVRLNNLLAPSQKFPNSFWNGRASLIVCDLCGYILIHHHLSIIKLSKNLGAEIFINAPSFKIMWYLNKYAKTLLEKLEKKDIKEILGLSIVEMSRRIHVQLGRWEKMNIEVVIKYREEEDKIDFFSLSSDVVNILSDKEIASVLSQINEFKILELILDGKFREILDFGERVLKIALKQVGEKQDSKDSKNDLIENNVRLEKNRKNLVEFAQKLFKLYALIEQKLKREAIL